MILKRFEGKLITMKKLVILPLLVVSIGLYAQETQNTFELDYASASIGYSINQTPDLPIATLKALAPNSALIEKYGHFLKPEQHHSGNYANGLREVQLNVGFRNTNHPGQHLQLGLTYQGKMSRAATQGVSYMTTIDTLTSQNTGAQYPVDSAYTQNMIAGYSSNVLRLMASYRFHQSVGERWSLYGGLGGSVGVAVRPRVDITYLEASRKDVQGLDTSTPQGHVRVDASNVIAESYDSKTSFSFGAFVPLGVDFTVGTWDKSIRRLDVFLEAQPGVFAQYVPEGKAVLHALNSVQTIGVRLGF